MSRSTHAVMPSSFSSVNRVPHHDAIQVAIAYLPDAL